MLDTEIEVLQQYSENHDSGTRFDDLFGQMTSDDAKAVAKMFLKLAEKPVFSNERKCGRIIACEQESKSLSKTFAFFNSVLENIPEFVLVVRNKEILYKNFVATNIIKRLSERPGRENILTFLKERKPKRKKETLAYYDPLLKRWFAINKSVIMWMDGLDADMYVASDITAHKKTEKRLKRAAEYDTLTEVGNRNFGMRIFNEALHQKRNFPMCICFLDLDGLKLINDNYSHAAGDAYLKFITSTFKRFIPANSICRMGGDEFFVIMKHTAYPEAMETIERIRAELLSNIGAGKAYSYDFSYGLVQIDEGEIKTAHELLQKADMLMYKQKQQKKGYGNGSGK